MFGADCVYYKHYIMKNFILTHLVGLLSLCAISAQNNIQGSIIDADNSPVSFANVILYQASDSTILKVEASDLDGYFTFNDIPDNSYWLNISYVGLEDYSSPIFELSQDKDWGTIQMSTLDNELAEVVVQRYRPILEVKPDKVVFNVESSVNAAGNDALELLRKAPGVVVDNNDNISLAGKNGVRIFINGKPSPLSGDDLAGYLKNLRSDDIDNVEIIKNPSAKYDAEGNAGIINIIMKKDKRLGANGRINSGFSYSQRWRYNGGISGNYKNKKINIFGSANGGHYEGINIFDLYREQANAIYDQKTNRNFEGEYHNYNAGLDYFINDKQTIGILWDGNFGTHRNNVIGKTLIYDDFSQGVDSILMAETSSVSQNYNINTNINYQLRMEGEKSLNMDLDIGQYMNQSDEDQPNYYMDANEAVTLSENIFNNLSDTRINIGTFKIDYSQPLGKGQMEMGIKSALVKTQNEFEVYDINNNQRNLDEDRSREFYYTENVNAIYANYNIQIKKIGIQSGLRMEQTYSKGELMANIETENDLVTRKYVGFFPSLGLSYQVNEKHGLQLNYSRRLRRPSYQNLNPFEFKLDELVFERGNPFLNPEYSNSITISHVFIQRFNTSLSYSHTQDMMAEIILQEDDKIFNSWRNVAHQNNVNLNISAPITITKWWNVFSNLSGTYQANHTINPVSGARENVDIYIFNGYVQNNFSLPWGMKMEVSGWYSSPNLWGFVRMGQMFSVDAGIQKAFADGKAKLRLGIDDIFYSQRWNGTNQYGESFARAVGRNDSRRIKLNFSYSFGNQNVKSRRRNKGNEAESNRIGE